MNLISSLPEKSSDSPWPAKSNFKKECFLSKEEVFNEVYGLLENKENLEKKINDSSSSTLVHNCALLLNPYKIEFSIEEKNILRELLFLHLEKLIELNPGRQCQSLLSKASNELSRECFYKLSEQFFLKLFKEEVPNRSLLIKLTLDLLRTNNNLECHLNLLTLIGDTIRYEIKESKEEEICKWHLPVELRKQFLLQNYRDKSNESGWNLLKRLITVFNGKGVIEEEIALKKAFGEDLFPLIEEAIARSSGMWILEAFSKIKSLFQCPKKKIHLIKNLAASELKKNHFENVKTIIHILKLSEEGNDLFFKAIVKQCFNHFEKTKNKMALEMAYLCLCFQSKKNLRFSSLLLQKIILERLRGFEAIRLNLLQDLLPLLTIRHENTIRRLYDILIYMNANEVYGFLSWIIKNDSRNFNFESVLGTILENAENSAKPQFIRFYLCFTLLYKERKTIFTEKSLLKILALMDMKKSSSFSRKFLSTFNNNPLTLLLRDQYLEKMTSLFNQQIEELTQDDRDLAVKLLLNGADFPTLSLESAESLFQKAILETNGKENYSKHDSQTIISLLKARIKFIERNKVLDLEFKTGSIDYTFFKFTEDNAEITLLLMKLILIMIKEKKIEDSDLPAVLKDISKKIRKASNFGSPDFWVEGFKEIQESLLSNYTKNANLLEVVRELSQDHPDYAILVLQTWFNLKKIDGPANQKVLSSQKRRSFTSFFPNLLQCIEPETSILVLTFLKFADVKKNITQENYYIFISLALENFSKVIQKSTPEQILILFPLLKSLLSKNLLGIKKEIIGFSLLKRVPLIFMEKGGDLKEFNKLEETLFLCFPRFRFKQVELKMKFYTETIALKNEYLDELFISYKKANRDEPKNILERAIFAEIRSSLSPKTPEKLIVLYLKKILFNPKLLNRPSYFSETASLLEVIKGFSFFEANSAPVLLKEYFNYIEKLNKKESGLKMLYQLALCTKNFLPLNLDVFVDIFFCLANLRWQNYSECRSARNHLSKIFKENLPILLYTSETLKHKIQFLCGLFNIMIISTSKTIENKPVSLIDNMTAISSKDYVEMFKLFKPYHEKEAMQDFQKILYFWIPIIPIPEVLAEVHEQIITYSLSSRSRRYRLQDFFESFENCLKKTSELLSFTTNLKTLAYQSLTYSLQQIPTSSEFKNNIEATGSFLMTCFDLKLVEGDSLFDLWLSTASLELKANKIIGILSTLISASNFENKKLKLTILQNACKEIVQLDKKVKIEAYISESLALLDKS